MNVQKMIQEVKEENGKIGGNEAIVREAAINGRNIFEKGCFSFFVGNWDDFVGGENWKVAYCIICN